MIELPKVEIHGQVREIRRFGLTDIFTVKKILGDLQAGAALRNIELDLEGVDPINNLLAFLAAGMTFAETSCTQWIYSWYSPALEPDQEIYLPELADTVVALVDHPDIKGFLERANVLIEKINDRLRKEEA